MPYGLKMQFIYNLIIEKFSINITNRHVVHQMVRELHQEFWIHSHQLRIWQCRFYHHRQCSCIVLDTIYNYKSRYFQKRIILILSIKFYNITKNLPILLLLPLDSSMMITPSSCKSQIIEILFWDKFFL